ncbi:beta-ketoacyl-ACP synthase II [Kocuria sp. HSID16901]|uniref:beta-ketoacyl-ACP synthase II n=1 Tax=Kocuria sp. HSID16901 TaxID=2419505 RepID=UPI0006600DF5|nr:beta-ketoacyl-ACP synthase II [Kocuria sp. HSID16901]RUQ22478.1 beta-ketoacyl-[acyl-carrier-protein] synthase II [Kocuria sp. HSID16901]
MSQKVVVTGLGAFSPIGGTVSETWDNALQGVSGVKTLTDDWVAEYDLPVYIAGRAGQSVEDSEFISKVETKRLDPSGQFAVIAAREAWKDAGFTADDADAAEELDPDRLAVSFGTGIGGVWTLLNSWDTLRERGPRRILPMTVPMLMPNGSAAAISLNHKARATAQTVVSACASSTESLHAGLDLIRSGKADVVIAGGTESAIHPMTLASFAKMQALSKRNDDPEAASRPYDVDRDGFVMGEGAAALILESEEHAQARGARVYAELAGSGVSSDAHHITANDPEGIGAARSIREALTAGDIAVEDVVHVNAHATSTPVGDPAEAIALRVAFGEHTDNIAVSATKSMTGHLLGAAGALEAVMTVLSVYDRKAPATINLENKDSEIDLDVVTEARELPSGDIVALSNSFGFGGHNAVVAFRSVN